MPPLGWYLAQGMYPLGHDSSDDEDGPCELPDGRLVCGLHGLSVCHRCCVDYNFGLEEDDDDEDDDHVQSNHGSPSDTPLTARANQAQPPSTVIRDISKLGLSDEEDYPKGTGSVFPSRFVPPSDSVTPEELFSGRVQWILVTRYVLPVNDGIGRTGLIYTDGACLGNGQDNPKAGWAFWHGEGPKGQRLIMSGRLETKGPYGDDGAQTCNRAELRAVIAALKLRHWPGEGFRKLVFATDSKYVVEGATAWARKWVRENWTRKVGRGGRGRTEVKNRDLWEALLGQIEKFKKSRMEVEFWRIRREWNTVADAAAKEAAAEPGEAPTRFETTFGINV